MDISEPDRPAYHHGDLRAALLAAGERVLDDTGAEGFSLRRVAREVGVSHAAPAHHFGDAAGLLAALAEIGFRRFLASMQDRQQAERQAGRDRPADLTMASGLGYVDFATASPALFRLMFGAPFRHDAPPGLVEAGNAAFQHLARDIARQQGLPDGVDAMQTAEGQRDVYATWALVHGYAGLLISGRIKALADADPATREAFLRRVLLRMIPASGGD